MVKITNGQMTLIVARSAFHTMYESSGFRILDDENGVAAPADTFNTPEKKAPETTIFDEEIEDSGEDEEPVEEDSEEEVDLSEIPLGEMGFDQLCEYADQLGLDRSGLRSKKELRNLIRENL